MLSEIVNNSKLEKIIISTGNILNINNTTLRKPHEELLESLKLCTACQKAAETENPTDQAAAQAGSGCDTKLEYHDNVVQLLRASRELEEKIKEHARNKIGIGVKLFLNKKSSKQMIDEAVNTLLQILKVDYVDNLVLAYHPLETASKTLPETPDGSSAAADDDSIGWGKRNEKNLDVLNELWTVLQEFNVKNRICQLGIADLDVEALTNLHKNAKVPPTINQVNLVKCCVVPQELKDFCTQHDIQLLTHSDPEILIADEDFIIPNYAVDWSLRYQIHLRCRGVLAAKGYILQASRMPQNPSSGGE